MFYRQPQAKVHAAAKWTQQQHLPITQLIARGLHDDPAISRYSPGAFALAAHQIAEIPRCRAVEMAFALEPIKATGLVKTWQKLAKESAHRLAEVESAAGLLPAPEGHHRRR